MSTKPNQLPPQHHDDTLDYNIEEFDIIVNKKNPFVYGVVLDRGFAREEPDIDHSEPQFDTSSKKTQIIQETLVETLVEDHNDVDFDDFNEDDSFNDEDDEDDEGLFPLSYNELEIDFGDEESTPLHLKDTKLIDRPMEEGNFVVREIDPISRKIIIGKVIRVFPLYDLLFLYSPKKCPSVPVKRHILLPNVPGHYLHKIYPAEWRTNYCIDNVKYHAVAQINNTTYRYHVKINKDLIISFTKVDTEYMTPVHPHNLPELSYPDEFAYYPGQQVKFTKKSINMLHFAYVKGTKADLLSIFGKKVTTCRGIITELEPLFCELQPLYNVADDWFDPAFDEREDHLRAYKTTMFPVSQHITSTIFDRVLVDSFVMNVLPHYHVGDNQQEWAQIVEKYHTYLSSSHLSALNLLDPEVSGALTSIPLLEKPYSLKNYCQAINMNGVSINNPHYAHDLLNTIIPFYDLTQDAQLSTKITKGKAPSIPTFASKRVMVGDGKVLPSTKLPENAPSSIIYDCINQYNQQIIKNMTTTNEPIIDQNGEDNVEKIKINQKDENIEDPEADDGPSKSIIPVPIIPEKVNHEWLHRCAYIYRQKTAVQVQWCVLSQNDGFSTPVNHISTHASTELKPYDEQTPVVPGQWYFKQNGSTTNQKTTGQQLCLVHDTDHIHKIANVQTVKKHHICTEHRQHTDDSTVFGTPAHSIKFDCGCIYELNEQYEMATYFELSDMYQINVGNVVLMYDTAHQLAAFSPKSLNTDEELIDTKLKVGVVEAYRFGVCVVKWWNDERSLIHPSLLNNIDDDGDGRADPDFDVELAQNAENIEKCPQDCENIPHLSIEQSNTNLSQLLHYYSSIRNKPMTFELIYNSSPPENHAFIKQTPNTSIKPARIRQEYKLFQSLTPDLGIFVRSWASRIDLMTIFIQGAQNTPYYGGLFQFDLFLPTNYPAEPPMMKFVSRYNSGATITQKTLHPNLYRNGHICLSLLGTWNSKNTTEQWTADSSVYQLLLSLSGLIFGVTDPFYSEAGYDVKRGTKNGCVDSILYNEGSVISSLSTLLYMDFTRNSGIAALEDKTMASYHNLQKYHLTMLIKNTNSENMIRELLKQDFNEHSVIEKDWIEYLQSKFLENSVQTVKITDSLISHFKAAKLSNNQQKQLSILQNYALPPDQSPQYDPNNESIATNTHEAIGEMVYYPTKGFVLQLQRLMNQINVGIYQRLLLVDITQLE